jgi:ABC-type phosphate transport system permease subunit
MIEKGTSPQIKRITQNFGFGLLGLMSSMTVVPILIVVIYIIQKGAPAISLEFLTGFPSDGMRSGGILPAIIGTLYLTFGTAVFPYRWGSGQRSIYLNMHRKTAGRGSYVSQLPTWRVSRRLCMAYSVWEYSLSFLNLAPAYWPLA